MKRYRTIVADPPWQYKNKKTGASMHSGSADKYPTLSLGELCSIKLPHDRSESMLFLWATVPMVREALHLMKAWGFKYKTSLFWIKKKRLGLGFWFRGQVEIVLFGICGKVKAFRSKERNVFESIPQKHSTKPQEFWQLIEPYTLFPRLEMFARERRKGWNVWGNEVKSDIQIEVKCE